MPLRSRKERNDSADLIAADPESTPPSRMRVVNGNLHGMDSPEEIVERLSDPKNPHTYLASPDKSSNNFLEISFKEKITDIYEFTSPTASPKQVAHTGNIPPPDPAPQLEFGSEPLLSHRPCHEFVLVAIALLFFITGVFYLLILPPCPACSACPPPPPPLPCQECCQCPDCPFGTRPSSVVDDLVPKQASQISCHGDSCQDNGLIDRELQDDDILADITENSTNVNSSNRPRRCAKCTCPAPPPPKCVSCSSCVLDCPRCVPICGTTNCQVEEAINKLYDRLEERFNSIHSLIDDLATKAELDETKDAILQGQKDISDGQLEIIEHILNSTRIITSYIPQDSCASDIIAYLQAEKNKTSIGASIFFPNGHEELSTYGKLMSVVSAIRYGFMQSEDRVVDPSLRASNCWYIEELPRSIFFKLDYTATLYEIILRHTDFARLSDRKTKLKSAPRQVTFYKFDCPSDPSDLSGFDKNTETVLAEIIFDPLHEGAERRVSIAKNNEDVTCIRAEITSNWASSEAEGQQDNDYTCVYSMEFIGSP